MWKREEIGSVLRGPRFKKEKWIRVTCNLGVFLEEIRFDGGGGILEKRDLGGI